MQSKNQVITLHSIRRLVINAKHPEFDCDVTVIDRLFDGHRAAASIFRVLMGWMPYSKRSDGAIYKSAKDLAKSANCSTKTVTRARSLLERVGFEVFLKKANGAPTNHFKLNPTKLIDALAKLFDVTVMHIREWLFGQDVPNGNGQDVSNQIAQDVPNVVDKMSQSITKESKQKEIHEESKTITTESSFAAASPEIQKIKDEVQTSITMVQSWVEQYSIQRVWEVLQVGRGKYQSGKIQNLGGWVHAALKGGYTWEQPKSEQLDGMRFITGEFADFIDH